MLLVLIDYLANQLLFWQIFIMYIIITIHITTFSSKVFGICDSIITSLQSFQEISSGYCCKVPLVHYILLFKSSGFVVLKEFIIFFHKIFVVKIYGKILWKNIYNKEEDSQNGTKRLKEINAFRV